jgi:hypothetical protein
MGEWVCRSRLLDLGTSWRWSSSRPGKRTPGIHCIVGWVGPRTGRDVAEKRKFLPLPRLELRLLGHLARSQSLYRLCYPGSTWLCGEEKILLPLPGIEPGLSEGDTIKLVKCRIVNKFSGWPPCRTQTHRAPCWHLPEEQHGVSRRGSTSAVTLHWEALSITL